MPAASASQGERSGWAWFDAVDALAPSFRSERNLPAALKLAVYSFTPVWLAGIFILIPGLRFLTSLGL